MFVELEEGIDGLVHVSDLSWNKKIKHPSEFVKKGEKLDVMVLEVDKDNRRLSLGHKQLEENPWDTFETIFTIGSIHEGTVVGVNDKGASVQMQYGVEAFAPSRHLKKANNQAVKEDETLEFEVIEFSKDSKRIIISHTNTWKAAEKSKAEADDKSRDKARKNASKAVKKINQNSQATTMGELDALSELRAKFAQAEKTERETPKAIAKEETKKVEEAPAQVSADSGKELKDIAGVGPAAVKKMNAMGINSIDDLLALNEEKIAALVEQDSKTSADQWNKWIEGAKSL